MSEKGYKQDSQAKKMLHRTIFVPMVELIKLLFKSQLRLFSKERVFLYPVKTGGESASKNLHHKDKMILSSSFHSCAKYRNSE